jgi:HD-GYP domain-containing protein (c-di-GMP phosphodiesterase class II)
VQEVAKGVQICRLGEGLAETRSESVHVKLLATGDGTEVMRFTFQPGARFGLLAEPGASALECYVVLEGKLVTFQNGQRVELLPGDSISASPALESCIFEAETAGSALFISSQPAFHLLHREASNLVNLAVEVEMKDGYTRDHCARLQALARQVALKLRLSTGQTANLLFASWLHDVGKVKVPGHILGKPGPLTPDEWAIMRQHPTWGRELVETTGMHEVALIVEQHHERLDGSGYPKGLKGDEIRIEAQIIAVVDSWDAMTTDRVYRKALRHEEALAELKRGEGTLYRADVLAAFFAALREGQE